MALADYKLRPGSGWRNVGAGLGRDRNPAALLAAWVGTMEIAMKMLFLAGLAAITSTAALAQAPAASVDATFAKMDANGDGSVDKAEFTRFTQERQSRQASELDAAFKALDKNGDGKMSKAEAAAVPEIASNFAALDFDRDGSLTNAEMRSALSKAQALEATK